jgi:hypothetical protein
VIESPALPGQGRGPGGPSVATAPEVPRAVAADDGAGVGGASVGEITMGDPGMSEGGWVPAPGRVGAGEERPIDPGSGPGEERRSVLRAEILPPGYDLESYIARNGDRLAAIDRRPPPSPSAGERRLSKLAAESYVRWKTGWDRERGVIGNHQYYRLPVPGEIGDPSFWSAADEPIGAKRLRVVLVTEGRIAQLEPEPELGREPGVRGAILSVVNEGLRFLLDEEPDSARARGRDAGRFLLSP